MGLSAASWRLHGPCQKAGHNNYKSPSLRSVDMASLSLGHGFFSFSGS
jgi:hypothetical protein